MTHDDPTHVRLVLYFENGVVEIEGKRRGAHFAVVQVPFEIDHLRRGELLKTNSNDYLVLFLELDAEDSGHIYGTASVMTTSDQSVAEMVADELAIHFDHCETIQQLEQECRQSGFIEWTDRQGVKPSQERERFRRH